MTEKDEARQRRLDLCQEFADEVSMWSSHKLRACHAQPEAVAAAERREEQDRQYAAIDGKWAVSNDPEHWDMANSFETKEDAIHFARKWGSGFVGQAKLATAKRLFTENIVRSMLRHAEDKLSEEDWPMYPLLSFSDKDLQYLTRVLVDALMQRRCVRPVYLIENSEEVVSL